MGNRSSLRLVKHFASYFRFQNRVESRVRRSQDNEEECGGPNDLVELQRREKHVASSSGLSVLNKRGQGGRATSLKH